MGFIDEMRDYSKQTIPSRTSDMTQGFAKEVTDTIIKAIEINHREKVGHKHYMSTNGLIKKFYYSDHFYVGFYLRDSYGFNKSYDNDSIAIDVKTIEDMNTVMQYVMQELNQFSSYKLDGETEGQGGAVAIQSYNCLNVLKELVNQSVMRGPACVPYATVIISTTINCDKNGIVQ